MKKKLAVGRAAPHLHSMKNKLIINGKEVEDYKLHVEGDCGDGSWIEWATFEDGTELTDTELEEFEKTYLGEILWR